MNTASSPPRRYFQPLYTTIHHFYVFFLGKLKKSFKFLKDFFMFVICVGCFALTNNGQTQDIVVARTQGPIYMGAAGGARRGKFFIFF